MITPIQVICYKTDVHPDHAHRWRSTAWLNVLKISGSQMKSHQINESHSWHTDSMDDGLDIKICLLPLILLYLKYVCAYILCIVSKPSVIDDSNIFVAVPCSRTILSLNLTAQGRWLPTYSRVSALGFLPFKREFSLANVAKCLH